MRHSNHSVRQRRFSAWAAGLSALLLAACGPGAVASVAPTPAPTPVVTPDPHLAAPVTADQVFRALAAARLGMTANNASAGGNNPDVVKLINAEIGSWPLRITEYRSAAALAKALAERSGEVPGRNESPYAFAALNVLIQYGPISAKAPSAPDATRQKAAASIVAVLDPLLWPLLQRAVIAIPSRTAEPVATPAPSAKPAKTPRPSKAPSAKP